MVVIAAYGKRNIRHNLVKQPPGDRNVRTELLVCSADGMDEREVRIFRPVCGHGSGNLFKAFVMENIEQVQFSRADEQMHVTFNDAGNDGIALVVMHAGFRPSQFHHVITAAHLQNQVAPSGQCFRKRLFRVHGDDTGIGDDQIRGHQIRGHGVRPKFTCQKPSNRAT